MPAIDGDIPDKAGNEFSEPFHEVGFPDLPSEPPMCDMSFSMSAEIEQQVCHERSFNSDALAMFLRRLHPSNTAAHVSSRIGVPIGTVQNWIDRKASPNVESFVRLVTAYGPECLRYASTNPIGWVDQTILFEKSESLKKQGLRSIMEAGEIAKGLL